MNHTITIGTPILQANQAFKYRYRLLPNGAYNAYTTINVQTINFTGLSTGKYEVEILFVSDVINDVECPPTITTFELIAEYDCIDWDANIFFEAENWYMTLTHSGTPILPPPCGYIIEYGILGQPPTILNYNVLPPSPLTWTITNDTYYVRVSLNVCEGKSIQCFYDELEWVPTCAPMTGVSATILAKLNQNGSLRYYLKISWTQSSPATLNLGRVYQQDRLVTTSPIVLSGVPEPQTVGTVYITSSQTSVEVELKPNLDIPAIQFGSPVVEARFLCYKGYIRDACSQEHYFTAYIQLG